MVYSIRQIYARIKANPAFFDERHKIVNDLKQPEKISKRQGQDDDSVVIY